MKGWLKIYGVNYQRREYFDIPYRTVTDWELGNRQMPEYLLRLMKYKVEVERLMKEGK